MRRFRQLEVGAGGPGGRREAKSGRLGGAIFEQQLSMDYRDHFDAVGKPLVNDAQVPFKQLADLAVRELRHDTARVGKLLKLQASRTNVRDQPPG